MSDEQDRPAEVEEPPDKPLTGMIATGEAQIIRNGRVVEDDDQNEETR